MIYPYQCECGETREIEASIKVGPPSAVQCASCKKDMQRIYGCRIDTSGCRDHDHIPEQHRVQRSSRPRSATAEEARFQRHINERRALARAGGNNVVIRQTHSVPADLYHGKIRETGDRDYWNDPKNLNRHRSTRVDE